MNFATDQKQQQAEYDADRRGREVAFAYQQADNKAIQGLLSLTKTGMQYADDMKKIREEEKANQDAKDFVFGDGGATIVQSPDEEPAEIQDRS